MFGLNNAYGNMYIGQILKVKGRQGASDFNMGPNSQVFLLNDTGDIIWLVITDELGRKTTIKPYDISEHIEEPQPDLNVLMQRMNDIEQKLGGLIHELTGDTSVTEQQATKQ